MFALCLTCLGPVVQYCGRGCDCNKAYGIATCDGLDDPGFEPRWEGEIFHIHPDRPEAHPPCCTIGTGYLLRRAVGWVVAFSAEVVNEWRCTSTPPPPLPSWHVIGMKLLGFDYKWFESCITRTECIKDMTPNCISATMWITYFLRQVAGVN
jgi:hypothetical protein